MKQNNYLAPCAEALTYDAETMLCSSAFIENYDVLNPVSSGDYESF